MTAETAPVLLPESAPAQEAPPADPRGEFNPSHPILDPEPVTVSPRAIECCGNCPGWKKAHPKAPFGQCLPAIRWLGSPMYTPDLAGCSLDEATKAKGATR